MATPIRLLLVALCAFLSSCTYVKHSFIQSKYKKIQQADPSQVNLKHMLDRDLYFVYGKTIAADNRFDNANMAVAAYSSAFKANERVNTMFFIGTGTHYGLNLPPGDYQLLVYADLNSNQMFEATEVVGVKEIHLNADANAEKVTGHVDIALDANTAVAWAETIPLSKASELTPSLFYPTGTIRQLDDPIFNESIATLGMYDPASFLEYAPTMFYALEEESGYKIPLVFVHGVDGNPRQFASIIEQLDRTRYKPWFFYYPSGADLDQLADFFYDIFLSGKVIPLGEMPMIVIAHSMGGLVARAAFNRYTGSADENQVKLFISMATPFGGHPAAEAGENNGIIVLPAWRDLNPNNLFITELFNKPLPNFMEHELFYAYKNDKTLKVGQNSDGVVPLSSQLDPRAQLQSSAQFGFNSNHTDILKNPEMINRMLSDISKVENVYPAAHLEILQQGGFDVDLGDRFSPQTQYVIHSAGRYMVALANGTITPLNKYQEHFVRVANGEENASNEQEEAYIYLQNKYPALTAK